MSDSRRTKHQSLLSDTEILSYLEAMNKNENPFIEKNLNEKSPLLRKDKNNKNLNTLENDFEILLPREKENDDEFVVVEVAQGGLAIGENKPKGKFANYSGKTLAFGLGFTNAIYTGVMGFKSSLPPNMSLGEGFKSLSSSEKFTAIARALGAFNINGMMGVDFNLQVPEKLRTIKQNPKTAAATVVGAAYAALGPFSIAISALEMMGIGLGFDLPLSLLAATSTFTGRLVGLVLFVNDIIAKVKGRFDYDVIYHRVAIEKLKHIKPTFKEQINHFLEDKTLSDATLLEILQELEKTLHTKTNDDQLKYSLGDVFEMETTPQRVKRHTSNLLDGSIAFSSFILALVIFTQKGVDGLLKIEELLSQASKKELTNIKDLPQYAKILAGIPSGLINAIFYAKVTEKAIPVLLDTIRTMIKLFKNLKHQKLLSMQNLLGLSLLGVLNYYASSSMRGVGQGIAANIDCVWNGILFPKADGTGYRFQIIFKDHLPDIAATIGALVNSVSTFALVNGMINSSPTKPNLGKMHISLDDVISYEEKKGHNISGTAYFHKLSQCSSVFFNLNKIYKANDKSVNQIPVHGATVDLPEDPEIRPNLI